MQNDGDFVDIILLLADLCPLQGSSRVCCMRSNGFTFALLHFEKTMLKMNAEWFKFKVHLNLCVVPNKTGMSVSKNIAPT
jgi:hypothetical protein